MRLTFKTEYIMVSKKTKMICRPVVRNGQPAGTYVSFNDRDREYIVFVSDGHWSLHYADPSGKLDQTEMKRLLDTYGQEDFKVFTKLLKTKQCKFSGPIFEL